VDDVAEGETGEERRKVTSHGWHVTFHLAEVAVPREPFRNILSLFDDLRRRPAPA
jgi:hypothetical protein